MRDRRLWWREWGVSTQSQAILVSRVISTFKMAGVRDLRKRRWLWGSGTRVDTGFARREGWRDNRHAYSRRRDEEAECCLDMGAKLYCVTSKSYIAPGNKTSSVRLTVSNIACICQLQSRAGPNSNKWQSPGKNTRINVRFLSLGDHKRVVQIHV